MRRKVKLKFPIEQMRGAAVSFRYANFAGTGRLQVFGEQDRADIRIISESFDGVRGTMRIIDFMSQEDVNQIRRAWEQGPAARFAVALPNRILEDIEKKSSLAAV